MGHRFHLITYYKHLKTGKIYQVFFIAVDCTNSTAGRNIVVYGVPNTEELYTRELNEFLEKFSYDSGDNLQNTITTEHVSSVINS